MREESKIEVGVLLYPGVEILEVAGPLEVFACARGFKTTSVGLLDGPVKSRGNLKLLPDYALGNCPHLDVLVIPGGAVEEVQDDKVLLRWLQAMTIRTGTLMSVCTGAWLLAVAGLLDGRSYTSADQYLDKLSKQVNGGKAVREVRFVDSGNIITTAGPASGIDGALQVVKRIRGSAAALEIARHLDYPGWSEPSTTERVAMQRNLENRDRVGNK